MIGVLSLDEMYIEPIKKLEYTYEPEYEKEIPERRYFRKLNDNGCHTHHIHLVEYDSLWWKRHIQFRDYLRHHPWAVKEYADLKKELASKFTDPKEYAKGKIEFVKRIKELDKNYKN